MIRLEDVGVTFDTPGGQVKAVSDVNMTINDGEIFGVIGYSGAGKSTLVRTINMLQKPTNGQVYVNDLQMNTLDQAALSQARRKIGMIFQHFNLMNARTVAGNIRFAMLGSERTAEEKDAKVKELLELVGLADRADAYPSQLSGGQKQRVAIARALANNPDVLLCDEATSALDPKTTEAILALLKKLNEELSLTVVIITHEMSVIKEICDRVAVMDSGYVVEQGSIFEIFTNPKEKLTQSFIESASPVEKGIQRILKHADILGIQPTDRLIRVNFSSQNTATPLVAQLARDFDILPSILYAYMEVLQDRPTGIFFLKISGPEEELAAALKYMDETEINWKEYELPEEVQ